jgi:hypothetical protein
MYFRCQTKCYATFNDLLFNPIRAFFKVRIAEEWCIQTGKMRPAIMTCYGSAIQLTHHFAFKYC